MSNENNNIETIEEDNNNITNDQTESSVKKSPKRMIKTISRPFENRRQKYLELKSLRKLVKEIKDEKTEEVRLYIIIYKIIKILININKIIYYSFSLKKKEED